MALAEIEIVDKDTKHVFEQGFKRTIPTFSTLQLIKLPKTNNRDRLRYLYSLVPGLEIQDQWSQAYHNGAETGNFSHDDEWIFCILICNMIYIRSLRQVYREIAKSQIRVLAKVFQSLRNKMRGELLVEDFF